MDWVRAWASVFATRNSTPPSPAEIMRLTALEPPPPTPTTLMQAPVRDPSSNRNRMDDVSGVLAVVVVPLFSAILASIEIVVLIKNLQPCQKPLRPRPGSLVKVVRLAATFSIQH